MDMCVHFFEIFNEFLCLCDFLFLYESLLKEFLHYKNGSVVL